MAYIGNTVQNQGFAPAVDYFNGDGTTVTFTLSRPVASVAQLTAVIENVIQNPSTAFTVSGSSITFTSAPPSGTNNIWVEYTSLITTYAAISQDPTVIGDITATGGYSATGDYGNSFVDGVIVDYVTGNARITTGASDGITLYNGGTASRSALMAITSAGNVGIGCTPSVVGSAAGYKAFYVGTTSGSGILGNGSDTYLLCNAYYDAAWKAVASANVSAYQLSGTTHYWRSAANPGAGGTLTWTNVMTLDKDQTLSLQGASTGVSGTGITFPASQNPSSNANTLDDYEEGTWTPQFSFAGGQTGITYGAQQGIYTKVGRVVTIQCYCLFSNKGSSTGQLRLQNLPFANSGTYCCASVWMNSFTGLSGAQQAFMGAGDTYLAFFYGGTGVSFSITNTNTANNSDVMVNMSYITS